MGTIFGTILAFLIVFGVLVFIHEFGHFFAAKLVGIRVEVFSFGLGKRLFGFKKGTTDYRISLLPFGGYVSLLGEGVFEPGKALQPDDLWAKTRFQRIFVFLMGPVMSILLAVVIATGINMAGVTSPEYLDQAPVIGWIASDSPAAKADLKADDLILAVNGRKTATWTEVELAVGTKPERLLTIDVRRGGEVFQVPLMTESRTKYAMGYAGFYGKVLTQVQMVTLGSPAEKGGLQAGDVITSINGEPAFYYRFIEIIEANAEKECEFRIDRGGRELTLRLTPRREGRVGKIGVMQAAKSVIKKYSLVPAIGQSLEENKRMAFLVVDFLKNLITGQASAKQLGGPLEIANFSYTAMRMGFLALMSWIGIFSLQLGILNFFPIPITDGGQIFVLIVESIFRKDLNAKARQVWIMIGWAIFIALMSFVVLNDIVKRLPHGWASLLPF